MTTYTEMRNIGMGRLESTNLYWRLVTIGEWFQQIWYAHHNAKVLCDMEYRMACLLTTTTRGMSNAYYSIEDMTSAAHELQMEMRDESYQEGWDDAVRLVAK